MSKPSSASLSVVPVTSLARIEAPSGLDAGEGQLFADVVNSKPADWFGEDSAPLLVEYVRAQGMCDQLDQNIKAALSGGRDGDEPIPLELLGKVIEGFMKLRDMEAKRMLSIGTKLRLTQQSRYTPKAASTANSKAGAARPWLQGNK